MKVLHICLMGAFTENLAYQENIMTLMHKIQGHEVLILASTETYVNRTTIGFTEKGSYTTREGIGVKRVSFSNLVPKIFRTKLRLYQSIYRIIENFSPDIIFVHDCQFFNILEVRNYVKMNKGVTLFIDSHTDQYNSGTTFLSKYVLHKIIYRSLVQLIVPYTKKFFGTLPVRVAFYINVYGTPESKTEFLPLGVNVQMIDFERRDIIKEITRKELNINNSTFLIITGGKIDQRKNVHLLMSAINQLKELDVKLLIFGEPDDNFKSVFHKELNSNADNILHVGWIPSNETYKYFFASDLAFFPGSHSTLWEEALGLGVPCVFKYWDGIDHVDMGGNCILLAEINVEIIKSTIIHLMSDYSQYKNMRSIARNVDNMDIFNYSRISKVALE